MFGSLPPDNVRQDKAKAERGLQLDFQDDNRKRI